MSEIRKTFDFTANNVEILDLETLKRTYREVNIAQQPLKGIHHFELIEKILQLCELNKLEYSIKEIFAAQNKDKNLPGVVKNPLIEKEFGTNSIESHCLRRVFTTIELSDQEDEETNTGLVISYHQEGIQIAIGPNVKICHNQCILSSERMITNYGSGSIKDFEKLFNVIDDWFKNFGEQRKRDVDILKAMKMINVGYRDVAELVGHLTFMRVGSDERIVDTRYPLNQGQISDFTGNYLRKCKAMREEKKGTQDSQDIDMSLYEIYNIATENFKGNQMNIPNIIPQNVAWAQLLTSQYNL